jgi:hypothetical protein
MGSYKARETKLHSGKDFFLFKNVAIKKVGVAASVCVECDSAKFL